MNSKKIILLVSAAWLWGSSSGSTGSYLTLVSLKANRRALMEFYATHRLATVAGFMAVYIIQTPCRCRCRDPFPGVRGRLRFDEGTVYAVVSVPSAPRWPFWSPATCCGILCWPGFGSRLEGMNRELEQRGLNYLLFLRLVPVFPFFLITWPPA